MAGGTDVVISCTKGFGSPNVISLAEIPGLDYVEYDSKNGLRIGAMATLQQVADNADVQKKYPALWKSASINGTPQTRNMASSRILPEFELLLPQSIKEAVDLLGKLKSKASVMAGGTDVVISCTKGFGSPNVISLAEIPALDYVEYDSKNGLRIGAMATLQQVADNADVQKRYPALWKSAAINGTPQTRNMGTVVGNIMRASPSGDCICAILAIGGKVVLRGPKGKREVSIDDFYLKYRETACKNDELAVEIKLPPVASGSCNAFARMTRTTLDLSKVNVAVRLDMSGKTVQGSTRCHRRSGADHDSAEKSRGAPERQARLPTMFSRRLLKQSPRKLSPLMMFAPRQSIAAM